VEFDTLSREDIKISITNNLSADLNKAGERKYNKPVQVFQDTFLRKHGFKAITIDGCTTQFKDAAEWRFSGLGCVEDERASAISRKTGNKIKPQTVVGGELSKIRKAKAAKKCVARKHTLKAKFLLSRP